MLIREFLHLKHFKKLRSCGTKLYVRCCHSLPDNSVKNKNEDGCFKQESDNPNVKFFTLNYGKFYRNIHIECKLNDISGLASTLKCAALTEQSSSLSKEIITVLENCISNLELDQALSIFQSLAIIQSNPNDYNNIMKKIYEVFIHDVENFSNIQAICILSSIVSKVADNRCTEFYDPKFLDALADWVFKNNEKNDPVESNALAFLQAFLGLKHQNKQVLVHVIEEFTHKLSYKLLPISEILDYYEAIFKSAKLMGVDLQKIYLWQKMTEIVQPDELMSQENGTELLLRTLNLSVLGEQKVVLKDSIIRLSQLDNISSSQAENIFQLLCSLPGFLDTYDCALQSLFGITSKDFGKLSDEQKLLIWKNKESKILIDGMEDHFYDPELLNSLVTNVIKKSINRRDAITLLKKLKNLRHKQPALVDYVLMQFLECDIQKILSTDSKKRKDLLTFLHTLVFFNYRNSKLSVILKSLDFDKLVDQFNAEQFCEFVFIITFLGHINRPMIEKLFGIKIELSEELRLKFFKLWQMTQCHPKLSEVKICEEVEKQIDSIKDSIKSKNEQFPLLPLLKQALGGNQYVKTNLTTKFHHHIDHVVCYRTGGFPIAINSNALNSAENLCVENIENPKNATLVLILYLPQSCFFRNNSELTGYSTIDVETIKKMNNNWQVITINSENFEKLSDSEKRIFLMNEINSVIPKFDLG